MNRALHISSILLAVTLITAMPAHFIFDHGHELTHLDGQGSVIHVHERDCETACDTGGCGSDIPVEPELHDASGCNEPHHGYPHAHGVSDHGYLSVRTASIFAAALQPVPVRSAFAVVTATAPIFTPDLPRYQTPSLDFPTLRGPPLS